MSDKKQVLKAAGIVGVFTMVSRVTGLIRDMVMAAMFGRGMLQDLFQLCFELPNTVRRVLGEGALSAFLVPLISERRANEGEASAWRFFNRTMNFMFLVALVIALLGMFFSREAFMVFGGLGLKLGRQALSADQLAASVELGARMTRIMFPFVIGLTLASILMAGCHTLRKFVAPSFGSVMLNLCMIAVGGVAVLTKNKGESAAIALCWAVLAGSALRLVIMLPPLWRGGWRWQPVLAWRDPQLLKLMRMLGLAVLTMSISQVNIIVSTSFAMYLDEGIKSALVFSQRLIQLPMALAATAVATAMLPQLTAYLLEGRGRDLQDLMNFAKRIEMVLMTPAMWGLIFFGQPILALLYQRGAWDAADTRAAYWALLFYAPGLLPQGWIRLLEPLFYARKDLKTPLKAALIAMVVNAVLNWFFALHTDMQQRGLALTFALSGFANYFALSYFLRRALPAGHELSVSHIPETFWKSTLAALLSCGVGLGFWLALVAVLGEPGNWLARAAMLLPMLAGVAVLYFLLTRLLRVPESDQATEILLRKLRRR